MASSSSIFRRFTCTDAPPPSKPSDPAPARRQSDDRAMTERERGGLSETERESKRASGWNRASGWGVVLLVRGGAPRGARGRGGRPPPCLPAPRSAPRPAAPCMPAASQQQQLSSSAASQHLSSM
eukprot:1712234-Rhodomonas_salina.1